MIRTHTEHVGHFSVLGTRDACSGAGIRSHVFISKTLSRVPYMVDQLTRLCNGRTDVRHNKGQCAFAPHLAKGTVPVHNQPVP